MVSKGLCFALTGCNGSSSLGRRLVSGARGGDRTPHSTGQRGGPGERSGDLQLLADLQRGNKMLMSRVVTKVHFLSECVDFS